MEMGSIQMQRRSRKKRWIAVGVAGVLLATYLGLRLLGSVVVADPGGQVVSATILAGNGARQPMHRLPGGTFATIPRIEGEIEVRCRNGSASRGGYVTPHMDEQLEVTSPCRLAMR